MHEQKWVQGCAPQQDPSPYSKKKIYENPSSYKLFRKNVYLFQTKPCPHSPPLEIILGSFSDIGTGIGTQVRGPSSPKVNKDL
jgi:hypothetical protein